eukprot:8910974-Alexandrium_andersonii.AAC.1
MAVPPCLRLQALIDFPSQLGCSLPSVHAWELQSAPTGRCECWALLPLDSGRTCPYANGRDV